MHERERTLIALAQQGDKEILAQILEENKRTCMEYSKKIFRERIWSRRFISNCLYRIYWSNTEI